MLEQKKDVGTQSVTVNSRMRNTITHMYTIMQTYFYVSCRRDSMYHADVILLLGWIAHDLSWSMDVYSFELSKVVIKLN